jgi:2-iminobutanoate/2-iminopropanoate deaminase
MIEILKTVGASQKNVVKQTIYFAKGQDIREGYAATQNLAKFPDGH